MSGLDSTPEMDPTAALATPETALNFVLPPPDILPDEAGADDRQAADFYRSRFDNLLEATTNTHDMLNAMCVFLWLREEDGNRLPREKDLVRKMVQRCATVVSDDEGCANPNIVADTIFPVIEYLAAHKGANKSETKSVRTRMEELLQANNAGTAEGEAMGLMRLRYINGVKYESQIDKLVTETELTVIRKDLRPLPASSIDSQTGLFTGNHGLLYGQEVACRVLDYLASQGRNIPRDEDGSVSQNARQVNDMIRGIRVSKRGSNAYRDLQIGSLQKIANAVAASANRNFDEGLPTTHSSITDSMDTIIKAIDPVGYNEAFADPHGEHEKHRVYRAALEYLKHVERYANATRGREG